MTPTERAGWGKPFKFTDAERKALAGTLKRHDPKIIQGYLNVVQDLVFYLRLDWGTVGDLPFETPAQARKVLNKITKHSWELYQALDALDSASSLIVLSHMLSTLGRDIDTIEYFLNDLPLLHVCAKKASETTMESRLGRPADSMERGFISSLARHYVAMFSKKPSHSRGTAFPNFVRKVLEVALPGNPHTARDNSKIVKAALIDCGIIK